MIRLALRVPREHAELVLAELLELVPAGVEERDVDERLVEYAVYGAPGELPALPDLDAAVGTALVEVSTSEVGDDWHERWKQFHRPVLIRAPASLPRAVPALRVRPPWEPPASGSATAGALEIVIDPGQAFGTGAHATTRLCLELMLELGAAARPEGALLDVGTGSGVLAIAGAMLGYEPVLALDNDRESVRAAAANARANHVRVEVRCCDVLSDRLPGPGEREAPRRSGTAGADAAGPAPPQLLTANLLRGPLLGFASRLARAPAHLIAGGLLAREADEVAHAFARLGLTERQRRHSGEWAALWLAAPRSGAVG